MAGECDGEQGEKAQKYSLHSMTVFVLVCSMRRDCKDSDFWAIVSDVWAESSAMGPFLLHIGCQCQCFLDQTENTGMM
jgi:hypothetical protein